MKSTPRLIILAARESTWDKPRDCAPGLPEVCGQEQPDAGARPQQEEEHLLQVPEAGPKRRIPYVASRGLRAGQDHPSVYEITLEPETAFRFFKNIYIFD